MRNLSRFYAVILSGAMVLAASSAQAFTIENGDANSSGSSNLMAPSPFNDPVKKTDDKNGTRSQFGGTSVFIGPQSSPQSDYQTGINRMFSPLGRPPN